jgi:hypothetical protein
MKPVCRLLAVLFLFLLAGLVPAPAQAPAEIQQPAAAAPTSKAPAIVLIMRHAEKPSDAKDPNLAPQGFRRAQALPQLFTGPQPRLPRPEFLFASDAAKHSNRPMETIQPLSQALQERINHDYVDLETGPIAKQILSGKYAGKVVLICWHHGEIPHLAEALGVTDAPHKWDPDVFDQVWEIRWVGGQPHFHVVDEQLLPGDTKP